MIITNPHRPFDPAHNLWLGLVLLSRRSFSEPQAVVTVPLSILSSSLPRERWTISGYISEPHDATIMDVDSAKILADVTSKDWTEAIIDDVYVRCPAILLRERETLKRFCNEDLDFTKDRKTIKDCITQQLQTYLDEIDKIRPESLAKELKQLIKASILATRPDLKKW